MSEIPEVATLIAGEEYRTGRWYASVDPTTEQVLARIADCTPADADVAVACAAEAAPVWAGLDVDRRKHVLAVAADRLEERRAELTELAVSDTGARRAVAAQTQVGAAIDRVRLWSAMSADVLTLPPPPPQAGVSSAINRVPVGVVACISPYNFPLLAMVGKVCPALFAGNSVVMKPAPQDPLLVIALAEALRDGLVAAGAPVGAVNLLTGAQPELGAALVRHPDVGAVSFTGSTAVGVQIHTDAGPTMKRLLLELGGKGALIARADANLDAVVEAVTRTWTVQSGQVCLTPARLVADDAVHDALVDRLRDRLATLRIGDPRDVETQVGPVITAQQRSRVAALVDTARVEGCEVVERDDLPVKGFFAAPALVLGSTPKNTVAQEEVFGPVITVLRTRGDDEAVAAANSTRYGLYDYIFTADGDRARALAGQLHSAQVGLNTVQRHPSAPFGGNRASGIGRSGGVYSLDVYTNIQTQTAPLQENGMRDA